MLDKLEKLDKIEGHLNEVSASLASVEESIQFNEDDILLFSGGLHSRFALLSFKHLLAKV